MGDDRQLFTFVDGQIRRQSNAGRCLDVQGPSDAQYARNDTGAIGLPSNGAAVNEFTCNTALNQRWAFSGMIRNGAQVDLCLARGSDTDGAALSLATCNGSAEAQEFDYYF